LAKKGYTPWNKRINKDEFLRHYNKNPIGKPFLIGHIPWNKGTSTKCIIGEKISKTLKNKYNQGLLIHGMLGKYHSEKSKQKMSVSAIKRGNNHPNWIQTEEQKNKISLKLTGRKLSKEHIRNSLKKRIMSSLEIKFENIINKLQLPYKFVGNGDFFIERKNPDFININGEKIAVEVYYTKHKLNFGQTKNKTINEWKDGRSKIFNKYGWELIFFNEIEVNEDNILKIMGDKNF